MKLTKNYQSNELNYFVPEKTDWAEIISVAILVGLLMLSIYLLI